MEKNRVTWVDIAKYICIMCVMHSHLESATPILKEFYFPFYLSLFFFCSGYVYRPRNDFPAFAKKKMIQLFIPWLFFSVLNILLAQILSFHAHAPLTTELFWNFLQIRGHGDGMWFVAALFVTFFPFFFIIRWYEGCTSKAKAWWVLGIAWLLSALSNAYAARMAPNLLPWKDIALPWHLEYVFVAMFYMVLGYLFRMRLEPVFDRYHSAGIRWFLWILYLTAVKFGHRLGPLDQYVTNLLGIAAVVSLSKILPANPMVLYIGQNTLICFGLHGKLYSLLQAVCRKGIPSLYNGILGDALYASLFSIALTVLISLMLIPPIWVINRWFPFVIGRFPKRKNG